MKTTLAFLFLLLSNLCKADGIDCIHVFLNGELIYETERYDSDRETRTINVGDTLLFHAWTDWDPLSQATLSLQCSENGIDTTLIQIRNNQYGAQFIYVFREEDLKRELDVILNYHIRDFSPQAFLTIKDATL